MALNRTQCPHCFTTYLITEEQYRVSGGMVRCGTCRERFQARIIESQDAPKFDPRKAFIEPISEQENDLPAHIHEGPRDYEFAESHENNNENQTAETVLSELEESINSELTIEFEDDAPVTPASPEELETERILANIRARNIDRIPATDIRVDRDSDKKDTADPALNEHVSQHELSLPDRSDNDSKRPTQHDRIEPKIETPETSVTRNTAEDEELIDEVDQLIEDKILSTSEPSEFTEPDEPVTAQSETDIVFNLDKRPRRRASRWAMLPLLFILIGVLAAALIYQLWMKQLLVFPENSQTEQLIQSGVRPLAKELAERDIALPVRRNLSQLELLSAQTEPHPSRASTNLLRVSIMNRAEISQPLPWLELSLTDSEGRLVSRRQLSPRDYIYNNQIDSGIGPKELKKITIELLAFPKQATGYELKLLNK